MVKTLLSASKQEMRKYQRITEKNDLTKETTIINIGKKLSIYREVASHDKLEQTNQNIQKKEYAYSECNSKMKSNGIGFIMLH